MDEYGELDSTLIERAESLDDDDEPISLLKRSWEESKLEWATAFSTVLFRFSMFGMQVVTQSFIGHISQVELAAYSVVQTILDRLPMLYWTCFWCQIGMSSATETLCGQAFGAKHYRMMGIYLQRSWIINFVIVVILLPIYIFSTKIYTLVGEEDITDATEGISLWYIGNILGSIFTLTTMR